MSAPKSIRIPPDLEEATEGRWRQLGYATFAQYVRALIRYDLMCGGDHPLTLPVSQMPLEKQDKLDSFLLRLSKRGGSVRGQLFESIMDGSRRRQETLKPSEFLKKLMEEVG